MKSAIYQNYLPYRLKKNEQANPLLVMDDLYRNQAVFPVWRQDLYTWLKGIFSPYPVWTGKCPANMLYDLEQLERLTEAAWLLYTDDERRSFPVNEISEENIFPANAADCHVLQYWKWDFIPGG